MLLVVLLSSKFGVLARNEMSGLLAAGVGSPRRHSERGRVTGCHEGEVSADSRERGTDTHIVGCIDITFKLYVRCA